MKFKVGDRVRIRTDLKIFEKYGSQYFVRDMKQHEGKIAIITRVFDDYYFINLDSFYWTDEMLKPCDAVLTISQLQSEIDKLSNKVQKEYSNVISNRDKVNYLKEQLKQLKEESKKEKNKPILDDAEKEYLKNVIKPFKSRIKYISKETAYMDDYYIHIDLGNDDIALPFFKKETMYKGMELEKQYTLKELGLDE